MLTPTLNVSSHTQGPFCNFHLGMPDILHSAFLQPLVERLLAIKTQPLLSLLPPPQCLGALTKQPFLNRLLVLMVQPVLKFLQTMLLHSNTLQVLEEMRFRDEPMPTVSAAQDEPALRMTEICTLNLLEDNRLECPELDHEQVQQTSA